MSAKVCVFLFSTILVFCESSYLDTLRPCKIDDGECQGALVQSVIRDFAQSGLPEIDLPAIDPVDFKDLSVKVLDRVELALPEGQLDGIRNCHVDKYGTNIDKKHTWMDMTCNLTLDTKYKVHSNSSFIQELTGGHNIHGEGNGKVNVENLKIKYDFYYVIEKKNGEIYFVYQPKKTTYKYEFAGRVTFFADKLYIGAEESSKTLIALMNQNYKTVAANFGKYLIVKLIKILYKFILKFFNNVPARSYISNDLSAHLE